MTSTIFLAVFTFLAQVQGLESAELWASDLVSGRAEADLRALAETARLQQQPVVVMAPDSWRQQVRSLLRSEWPQGQLEMKKSPDGSMKAWLKSATAAASKSAPAPEMQLQGEPHQAAFQPEPERAAGQEIRSVQELAAETLRTPGLMPLGQPTPRPQGHISTVDRSKARGMTTTPAAQTAASSKSEPPPQPTQAAQQPDSTQPVVKEIDAAEEERRKMERIYNRGKPVRKSLPIHKIKRNDVLYVWDHNVLVVRKSSATMRHFWLREPHTLNLDQTAIRSEGNRLYRVIGPLRN